MVAADITFYSLVLFVHVIGTVAGLGVTFSYPILWTAARRRFPRSLPYVLATQERIGKGVIGPLTGLILLSGLYMVITEDGGFGFDDTFVQVGLPIALYLLVAGPLIFSPIEGRLAELADRDIVASGTGDVTFSDEFDAAYSRLMRIAAASISLIVIVVFFMAVKP